MDYKLNVDWFAQLLQHHPNQAFVLSMCQSLHKGFWPWADTKINPETWDFSDQPPKCWDYIDFITTQVETEVCLRHYSEAFRLGLLPGMYSSSVHTLDKPGTTTFQLINNQSAREFSPNLMINHEDVIGTCMDNIKSFSASLHTFHKANKDNAELIMWKSDIETTYYNLWLTKEWQAKQNSHCRQQCYINHCNCFGNCSSYKVFLSLCSLVAWVAENVKNMHLKVYVDNNASFDLVSNILYYEPYHHYFPTIQTRLLLFWDELNIPHAEKKQIYGPIVL